MALHKYWVGRSCPHRSRNLYKSRIKIQLLTRIWLRAPVRPSGPTGQTGQAQGWFLPGPQLPHPDSQRDVRHMHFDRLDEIYAMVKSNWHFVHFGLTGLTVVGQRSDRSGLLNRL
jgi:hypothetical protein